jgi:hypothetical protein
LLRLRRAVRRVVLRWWRVGPLSRLRLRVKRRVEVRVGKGRRRRLLGVSLHDGRRWHKGLGAVGVKRDVAVVVLERSRLLARVSAPVAVALVDRVAGGRAIRLLRGKETIVGRREAHLALELQSEWAHLCQLHGCGCRRRGKERTSSLTAPSPPSALFLAANCSYRLRRASYLGGQKRDGERSRESDAAGLAREWLR